MSASVYRAPIGKASDFKFVSFPNLIHGEEDIARLKDECKAIFSAKSTKGSSAYSEGTTFWIGADEKAKSLAESYALFLFRFYTKGIRDVDRSKSGAEFWPLCIDLSSANVAPHYDKDYGAEDKGLDIYPNVGTVTYLSEFGAPTLFFEQLESSPLPCPITHGWMSLVSPGKHVAFDGRMLHCAASQLLSSGAKRGERVTFLVNVWINHIPLDPVPCPYLPAVPFTPRPFDHFPPPEKLDQIRVQADKAERIEMTMEKKILKFCAPILTPKSTSIELLWDADISSLSKLNKKKEASSSLSSKRNQKSNRGGKR